MLGETQKKTFHESRERHFYELIFKRIDESIFEPLYSDTMSRPNAPINSMVSALILQNHSRWSYSFLFLQVRFDLLPRMAIGLVNLDEVPFCEARLFNFQKSGESKVSSRTKAWNRLDFTRVASGATLST